MANEPYRIPRWARALLAVDKVACRIASVREAMRDELLLAFIPPEDRTALTAAIYAGQDTYLPTGHRFQSGLFPWEQRMIDAPSFPRKGHILIGAAGAGRELMALLSRGYSVTAFDPCATFVESALPLVRDKPAEILCGSYEDLIGATEGKQTRLSGLLKKPAFDGVILGWGSLSHVLPAASRRALFRALRTVAPNGPVLASFVVRHDTPGPPESKGRVRNALRRAFAAVGAPGISEPGDFFFPNAGFFSYLAPDEIPQFAFEAGYEVTAFEDGPYPHAFFTPLHVSGFAKGNA
jgi:hypothetical protein